MIAVFTLTQRDFDLMDFKPRKNFIRIKNINHIRGCIFTGVLLYHDYYESDKKTLDALEYLKIRQPELFKQ